MNKLFAAPLPLLLLASVPSALAEDDAPPIAELQKELSGALDKCRAALDAFRRFQKDFDRTGKTAKERKEKSLEFGKQFAQHLSKISQAQGLVDHVLRPLLEAKKDEPKGTTPAHYSTAMELLVQKGQAGRSVSVGAAGTLVFPKNFELRVQHGEGLLESALAADDDSFDDLIEGAEKQFKRARVLKEESAKPEFGLYRIQEVLGEDEKALAHLDKALEKKGADDEIDRPRIRRGQLLLRLGRTRDAARQFDTSLARKQNYFQACVLAARAHLGDGKSDRAERAMERLVKEEGATPRVVQAHADLLWGLGRRDEARALLASKRPNKKDGESAAEAAERRSYEAMECLFGATDLEKTRRALPAILGLSYFIQVRKKDDEKTYERKNMDMNPTFMLHSLKYADKTAQYWAEEVLATLCYFALPKYESIEDERWIEVQLFEFADRDEMRKEATRKAQLEYLESYLGTPDFRGALYVQELCKELRTKL